MDLVFFLLPLSLILASGAVAAFIWTTRSGQFDDLETPAHRVLFDDAAAESKEPDEIHRNGDSEIKSGDTNKTLKR